jgi:PKD repeat protein
VKLTVSNDLGSDFMAKNSYIHVGSTGISEKELEEQMSVYPNPSQGSFQLEMKSVSLKGSSVHVINAKGEIVYHQEISGDIDKIAIDLKDQPAGIYMVKLQLDEMSIIKKLTIVN